MKKHYTSTLLILLVIGSKIFAQPTYTQANFPSVGTVLTSITVDPTGLTPGNSGAGQTWDFSTAPITGSPAVTNVVSPASTPYASSFPTASFAQSQTNGGGSTAYIYYTINASNAEQIGFVSANATTTINYSYSDPRRVMNFPFTFNSTFTDTYTGFASYIVSSLTVNQYRRGTVIYTADAYGTVINATGSHSNVLRAKTIESTVDSSVYSGFPIPATVTQSEVVAYSWTGNSPFYQEFALSYDSIYVDGTFNSASVVASYMDNSSAVNDLSPRANSLTVYPNPSGQNDFIHLKADALNPGITEFIVQDIQGRDVKKFDFMIMPAAHHSVDVELSDLTPGIYSIRLRQSDIVFSTRFVKQ